MDLLGPTLLSNQGEVDTANALEGRTVGFYFSAHWCPPCRQFTPQLAKAYATLRTKGLEVVFVSGDKDDNSFQTYFLEMPWLAVPFCARDEAKALQTRFSVAGIPCLVLVGKDGALMSANAKEMILVDPEGCNFPWTGSTEGKVPHGMTQMFAEKNANMIGSIRKLSSDLLYAYAVPGVIECIAGVFFEISSCPQSILVLWLLVDGPWSLVAMFLEYYDSIRSLRLQENTDLQAYLIRKERDGATDVEMEASLLASQNKLQWTGTISLLIQAVGLYLYLVTPSDGCNAMVSSVVFYVFILRLLLPCFMCCSAIRVLAAAN